MRTRLGDAFDFNPKVKLPKGTAAPFVDMASLAPFTRAVSADSTKPYGGGSKFIDGDVLMARITPSLENGKTSRFRALPGEAHLPSFGSTEFIVIRGRDGVSDSTYAYYLFTSNEVREHAIASMNGSSGRQRVQIESLAEFEIDLPPLPEQRAIAATLGALDDKIESNRRAVAVAEELAAARLSAGERKVRVGDIATVSKGLSYKGAGLDDGETPGARPMLNLGSFTKSRALNWAGMKFYTGGFKPKHVLAPWDLVIANTDLTQERDFVGRGVIVPGTLNGALHTHHTSKVVFDQQAELALPLWAQLESPAFRARAKGFATGTTVASLPPEAILDFEITVPDDLGAALADAKSLIEASWQKHQEAQRLTALRDALLPELLSGRIRVPVDEAA